MSFEDKFVVLCDKLKLLGNSNLRKKLMRLCSDHLFVYKREILTCYNNLKWPLSHYPVHLYYWIDRARTIKKSYVSCVDTFLETRPTHPITIKEIHEYAYVLGLEDQVLIDKLHAVLTGRHYVGSRITIEDDDDAENSDPETNNEDDGDSDNWSDWEYP